MLEKDGVRSREERCWPMLIVRVRANFAALGVALSMAFLSYGQEHGLAG